MSSPKSPKESATCTRRRESFTGSFRSVVSRLASRADFLSL